MNNITCVDILRSILIGQSTFLILLAVTNVILTLHYQKPRAGRFVGLVLSTMSFVIAVCLVVIGTVRRLGLPADLYVWATVVMVATGTLGFCLLAVHSMLHSDRFIKIITDWLK